jgi:hypothetical protein
VLRIRDRVHRRIYEAEVLDTDRDGIPDLYERATKADLRRAAGGRQTPTPPQGRADLTDGERRSAEYGPG